MNSDGSFYANSGLATCGGVLRDENGNFMVAFAAKVGSCSVMHAELWGILHGVRLAVSRGYNNIVVEADSKSAIQFLTAGYSKYHPCAPLLNEIKACLSGKSVMFSHTFREANAVADALANYAHTLEFRMKIFEHIPAFIYVPLYADAAAVLFSRDV